MKIISVESGRRWRASLKATGWRSEAKHENVTDAKADIQVGCAGGLGDVQRLGHVCKSLI
ncbi:hypothetical protein HCH_03675 [Hahella chejuensis KCTC 2396]|uniref:Uncharacterized protein n=1 Tax=Hahella chejuensis (strain KCTC 2396) TaxID=349521 RepID=Q2SG08_HAHCH|nr:hypothetical protein HCH_03675 [Hahella chejuensis KCTC 2396]